MDVYGDYTPAELFWMSRAKISQEWDHTSNLLAMIVNIVSKKKANPVDFHPYMSKKEAGMSLAEFKARLRKLKGKKER